MMGWPSKCSIHQQFCASKVKIFHIRFCEATSAMISSLFDDSIKSYLKKTSESCMSYIIFWSNSEMLTLERQEDWDFGRGDTGG